MACLRKFPILLYVLFGSAVLAPSTPAQSVDRPSTARPSLHYFVIDRSGSITQRGLTVPVRGALIVELGKLPRHSEVRVVLFNQRADRRASYRIIDTNALGRFSEWFDANFVPQGDTRLFDTVGEVLEEINRDKSNYSAIYLTILSDGLEEPPISTKYRSWRDLEPLARSLKMSSPPFFGTWYTADGFAPADRPDSTLIRTAVAEKGEVIADDRGPDLLIATFKADPTAGVAPLTVTFTTTTVEDVPAYQWDFGDSSSSDLKNPVHRYDVPGKYTPRLFITNPNGQISKSTGDIVISVEAPAPPPPPFPWWILGPLAVLAYFAVVHFWAKPRMTPHSGVRFTSDVPHDLHRLVRKNPRRWLWPRGSASFGNDPVDLIQIPGLSGRSTVARVHRTFATRVYRLTSLSSDSIHKVIADGPGPGDLVTEPIRAGRSVLLKPGDRIRIGDRLFAWEQPPPSRHEH